MGGVDHADRLRVTYGVNRRAKKWWHRIFWGLIDIVFVNAYIIYSELNEKKTILDFRRSVALAFLTQKQVSSRKRKSTTKSDCPNKRHKSSYSVPRDVRISNRGCHWVRYTNQRGRCEVCSANKICTIKTPFCM